MDEAPRQSPYLIGIVLLVLLVGLAGAMVPVVACPACGGRPTGVLLKNGSPLELADLEDTGTFVTGRRKSGGSVRIARSDVAGFLHCNRCSGRGRITIFRRMRWTP